MQTAGISITRYNNDHLEMRFKCKTVPTGAFPYSNAGQNYTIDGVPIWLYNLNCSGHEQELSNCSFVKSSYGYCNHYNDATVRCPGKVMKYDIVIVLLTLWLLLQINHQHSTAQMEKFVW